MTTEQQLAAVTDKMNALENESRRILRALNWATKVRLILFCGLFLFVLTSAFLFYRLYIDIRHNRLAEVQRTIESQPELFSEPLTRQVLRLAEDEGPHIAEVFRLQAEADSDVIVAAMNAERDVLIKNLQKDMQEKLTASFSKMLDEQEELLIKEFPVLEDPEKMENVRNNMEKVYQQFGQRYYVDFMKEELEEIAGKLDEFPASQPKMANISVAEQIALELFELIRMTLVYADNYVFPDDSNLKTGNSGAESSTTTAVESGSPPSTSEEGDAGKTDDLARNAGGN